MSKENAYIGELNRALTRARGELTHYQAAETNASDPAVIKWYRIEAGSTLMQITRLEMSLEDYTASLTQ